MIDKLQNITICNNYFIIKGKNGKKRHVFENDIKSLLEHNKLELNNTRLRQLGDLAKLLFPKSVEIFDNTLLVNKDFTFTHEKFLKRMKELHTIDIMSRKCPKNHSRIIPKERSCDRFFQCLIENNGITPKGCPAIKEKGTIIIKNKDVIREISLKRLKLIDSFAFEKAKNIIEEIEQTLSEPEQKTRLKQTVTATVISSHINMVQVKIDVEKDIHKNETLKQLKERDPRAFELIVKSIRKEAKEIAKKLETRAKTKICPFVKRTYGCSIEKDPLLGDGGTCLIKCKWKEPVWVTSNRKPYMYIPPIKTSCSFNFTADKYPNCWIFQKIASEQQKRSAKHFSST